MQSALVTVLVAVCLASVANFRQFNHKTIVKVGVPVKLNNNDSLEILDVMKTLSWLENLQKDE